MLLENIEIRLRALEPEDLSDIFRWENDAELWQYGNTLAPYSRFALKQYLEDSLHGDFFQNKQLRLIIELNGSKPTTIGAIDLFDFEPHHRRAALGILIEKDFQRQGYGSQAVELMKRYAFEYLHLHQIYVHVAESNDRSRKLFEKMGFLQVGILKQWQKVDKGYADVCIFQLINNHD